MVILKTRIGVESAFSLDCSAENLRIATPRTSDFDPSLHMQAETVMHDGLVVFKTSQGLEMQATLLKLTRFLVAFEVCGPAVLRTSEVLQDFKIIMQDRPVYCGRAVVSELVNTGTVVVCEAALQDAWVDIDFAAPASLHEALRAGFSTFLRQWQKVYKIDPEYKVVIADLQTFLMDLRLWLEQV